MTETNMPEYKVAFRTGLDPEYVARGLALAKDSNAFGLPLESLTREELLAVAADGWDRYRKSLGRALPLPL